MFNDKKAQALPFSFESCLANCGIRYVMLLSNCVEFTGTGLPLSKVLIPPSEQVLEKKKLVILESQSIPVLALPTVRSG